MSVAQVLFYGLAALVLLGALAILFSKNIIRAAFLLIGVLVGIAAIYALSGAMFLAVAQLMVYVGGILVLLIFGVMLTHSSKEATLRGGSHNIWLGGFLGISLFLGMVYTLLKQPFETKLPTENIWQSTAQMAWLLASDYLLVFELLGVLLLLALVGAAFVVRKNI
ncbi:NADH-quinone oxidoreductase subunit J [Cytophagales bacterium LB-30]|uniref:NADH-quinone oxidoreductase subunit J n=1 Tax=Shiella aurantiaca TaxID=3058365 RepID=A0ABT8F9N7_9BACT|nr:NADH-quinone oxidoreductase subunit J [Shiella aurantiaca]MDN4166998.1 NADH-quinone oxidoreductase subunit J [Shiella aurantiaca]